jgi:hypothetical protein
VARSTGAGVRPGGPVNDPMLVLVASVARLAAATDAARASPCSLSACTSDQSPPPACALWSQYVVAPYRPATCRVLCVLGSIVPTPTQLSSLRGRTTTDPWPERVRRRRRRSGPRSVRRMIKEKIRFRCSFSVPVFEQQ